MYSPQHFDFQIFILDERQHPTGSILDPSLQDAQGPAFVAFNDGILLDKLGVLEENSFIE